MARGMMRFVLAAALALCVSAPAVAQSTYPTPAGSRVNGVVDLVCDSTGANCAPPPASGATDAGPSTKIGCVFNSTQPTVTNGQRVDGQCTNKGELLVTISQGASVSPVASTASDGLNTAVGTTGSMPSRSLCYAMNATTWDRCRNIIGAVAAGTGDLAVAIAPHSAASGAITPIVSTAAESSHILKASAGNLYRISITTAGTAGYLMVFNATTAPSDGAVTPIVCIAVAANSSYTRDYAEMPSAYATGMTAVFSSTGCFTKTASATAFFEGSVM